MELLREEKNVLDEKEIVAWIKKFQKDYVPRLTKCKRYSKGDNPDIVDKKKKDVNNPDHRVPISYGRKLITTFTGYGYRPNYISYDVDEESDKKYLDMVTADFEMNGEHLKTSLNGKQTGIYGYSVELIYIKGNEQGADIRFTPQDPATVILLYDYSIEPKLKIAIRFVMIHEKKYAVSVYYTDTIIDYELTTDYVENTEWKLEPTGEEFENFFGEIPFVAYYLDDDVEGIIWPVRQLINMMDALISGNMDEFDRFANSYLRIVGMSLEDPVANKSGLAVINALQQIKRRRAFERLKNKDDVTFLTKDLPTEFLQMMYSIIKEQIHKQSHIPDMDQRELSGVAVDRMMFDFENVVSTAESYFDAGLYRRIEIMNIIYKARGMEVKEPSVIKISHKRNMPLNIKEFADTALTMSQAGFSREAILRTMPDDIIPDIDAEIQREKEEQQDMFQDSVIQDTEDADITTA